MDETVLSDAHYIRSTGNDGLHPDRPPVTDEDAFEAVEALHAVMRWFVTDYLRMRDHSIPPFDHTLLKPPQEPTPPDPSPKPLGLRHLFEAGEIDLLRVIAMVANPDLPTGIRAEAAAVSLAGLARSHAELMNAHEIAPQA